jgi:alpha-ketoglutarate-dependent taurine dioxygenase
LEADLSTTQTIQTRKLTDTVGGEVLDVDVERFQNDENLPRAVMDALEEHGMLVFRGLGIDDDTQVKFCRKLGEVVLFPGEPNEEILVVSLDPEHPYAPHLKAGEAWHMDDTRNKAPSKATMLSAKVVATQGGETEFASTYAAYDDLSNAEKEQVENLRVIHSPAAIQTLIYPNPTDEQRAFWRSQVQEHPLVWRHKDGRKSLVIGLTAEHVVGMDPDESSALLAGLLTRATRPGRVYRHVWSDADTIMWNNPGVLHQRLPYDPASHRRMHRTTIAGTPTE